MSRKPEVIVEEFLSASDQQVRLNALTALLEIGSEDSLRKFADVAVNGSDVQRADIGKLVKDMSPEFAAQVADAAVPLLKSPATRQSAYMLLAGLRSRGAKVALPPLSWRVRWELAGELRYRVSALGVDYSRVATLLSAIIANLLAAVMIVTSLLLHRAYLDSSDFLLVAFCGTTLVTGIAVLTLRRMVPISMVPDHAMGLIRGLGRAGEIGLALGGSIALIAAFNATTTRGGQGFREVLTAAGIVLLGAPLMAFGCFFGTHWSRGALQSRLDIWVRAAAGGILGTLLVTGVVIFFNAAARDFLGGFWLLAIPVAVGYSAHLARFDHPWREMPAARYRPWLVAAPLFAGFAFLVVLPRMTVTAPGNGVVSAQPLSRVGLYQFGVWQAPRKGKLLIPATERDRTYSFSAEFPQLNPSTPLFPQLQLQWTRNNVIVGENDLIRKVQPGEYEYQLSYPPMFTDSDTPEGAMFSYQRIRLFDVLEVLAFRARPDMLRTRFGLGDPKGPAPVQLYLVRQ